MQTQNDKQNEAQNDPQDDELKPDTVNWARKFGYNPDVEPVLGRRPARRKIFQQLGKMGDLQAPYPVVTTTTTTTTSATPPRQPKDVLDLDWSKMQLGRALKGDHDKRVNLMSIAGQDYVLKGAEGTPKDHVRASAFLNSLGLKGVEVPKTRVLDDTEKSGLVQSLSQGDKNAQDMSRALAKGVGQVSELAQGENPNTIFLSNFLEPPVRNALKLRETILAGLGQDEAWQKTFDAMLAKTQALNTKFLAASYDKTPDPAMTQRLRKWRDATDDKTRKEALAWMRGEGSGHFDYVQASLIDIMSDVDKGEVEEGRKRMVDEAGDRKKRQAEYKGFVESTEGMEAFAGVAIGDLLTGMHDRMSTTWNGGNFLFDAKTRKLCCIDNAKNPDYALGGDAAKWLAWFGKETGDERPLEAILFDRVYGKDDHPDDPDAPGNIVDHAKLDVAKGQAKFREVLENVVSKVEQDGKADPDARARVALLKARMAFDDIMLVPPRLTTPPALPAKLGKTEKAGRKIGGMFSRDKSGKLKGTQAIKDALRAGTMSADQARTQLAALEQQSKTLSTDRRSGKIQFLAMAMEFREALDQRVAALAALRKLNPPPEVFTDELLRTRSQALRDARDAWLTAAAKEDKILTMIEAAWAALPDEVRKG